MLRKDSEKENKEYLRSIIGVRGKLIDWKNSVGKDIECEYDGRSGYFKGVLKIHKYDTKSGKIYFKGYEKGIHKGDLIKCRLGIVLGFISSEFKYEIGVTMNYLTIINREYRDNEKGIKRKFYNYKCNKCGNIDWIEESSLKSGCGCNACCSTPRKVVLGINTIWDVARWMIDLGVSKEDAKTHTPCSGDKVKVKCPNCGRDKKIPLDRIYNSHSIGCSCGDGISYPEKLMESVLIQLKIEYKRQYKTDWSKNKIYDFYLPDYNIIIEVHGEQHYEESRRGRSLKQEQENDKLKEELALNNGVEYYIVVDCRKSELEYIKNNILNSELNKLFDLSKIDWIKCEEYALKNKVKEVCDYYKEHPMVITSDLAKEFSISSKTIREYLKRGTELGWCEYDAKEEMRRNGRLKGKSGAKPVSQFTLEGEFIKTYPSAREVEKQIGISYKYISACCRGKQKTAGGYVWKFA